MCLSNMKSAPAPATATAPATAPATATAPAKNNISRKPYNEARTMTTRLAEALSGWIQNGFCWVF